jgi:tetratricopeptide (TPR) repeat protein
VIARIDAHAESWTAEHRDACEATHVRGEQSDQALDLRMACLERRRVELDALAAVLEQSDAIALQRAGDAVAGLVPIAACREVQRLQAEPVPLDDPELRATADALRADIARAGAHAETGRGPQAIELARAAVVGADALGYAPVRAEAGLALAIALNRSGAAVEAETALHGAIEAAAHGKHDAIAAAAWVRLVHVVGHAQRRHDDATAFLRAARAAVARAGDDASDRVRLGNAEGSLLAGAGDHAGAVAQLERTLAIAEAELGEGAPLLAMTLSNLGAALLQRGEAARARSQLERAVALREDLLGPDHPDLADALDNLGLVYASLGDIDRALANHARTLAIRSTWYGERHRSVASSHESMGYAHLVAGHFAEAAAAYREALAIREPVDPKSRFVAIDLGNLGGALEGQGEWVEAADSYRRAIEVWDGMVGPEHGAVVAALAGHARAELQRGELSRAQDLAERAVERSGDPGVSPLVAADARFALARVLWQQGRDRARALELARLAHDAHAASPGVGPGAREREEIERWLAEHG